MHMALIQNMENNMGLPTNIVYRMQGGTSCTRSIMTLHEPDMHWTVFLGHCMPLNKNVNYCSLIMMVSLKNGKLKQCPCCKPCTTGYKRHCRKQLKGRPSTKRLLIH